MSEPVLTAQIIVPIDGRDRSFDISIKKGLTALIGPSGAGKTSLARALAGLQGKASGQISFNDLNTSINSVQKGRIGMVMQESALFPTMTAGQNIEIARQIPESEVRQLIEKTGVSGLLDKPAAVLSGGEARRIALVRAFAAKPQLLILDEPTSGLDPRKRLEILRISRQIACSRNVQILLITHNLEEMLAAADHAILMHQGEILAAGDVADVLSHPKTADLLAIDDAGSLIAAKIMGREGGLLKAEFGNQSLYLQDDGEPEGASVRLRILARDVALSTGPLEGVSILNQLSGTVETLSSGAGTASVTVSVEGQRLVSRITEKSSKDMNLEEGQAITCLVKAVAVKELMQE